MTYKACDQKKFHGKDDKGGSIELPMQLLREALFTFGRLHPELRILSVPFRTFRTFRIFEEILYGGSEVRYMSWLASTN